MTNITGSSILKGAAANEYRTLSGMSTEDLQLAVTGLWFAGTRLRVARKILAERKAK